MKKAVILLLIGALLLTMSMGCAWSNKAKGGAIGAGAGGVIGGVIGNAAGDDGGPAGSEDRAHRRRNQDNV